jgi:hypothetical protein
MNKLSYYSIYIFSAIVITSTIAAEPKSNDERMRAIEEQIKANKASTAIRGGVFQPRAVGTKSGKEITIDAHEMPIASLAPMYAALINKEVLLSESAAGVLVTVSGSSKDRNAILRLIDDAFKSKGVLITPLGEETVALYKERDRKLPSKEHREN